MNNQERASRNRWNSRFFAGWLLLAGALVMTTGAIRSELNAPMVPGAERREAAVAAERRARETMLAGVVRSWQGISFGQTDRTYFEDQLELARNIMFEAGIESFAGKLAVACVTMNRVRSATYPPTVKGVIWQRYQFSWTHLPKYARYRVPNWVAAIERTGKRQPGWRAAWADSKRAAAKVLTGAHDCAPLAGIYHYLNPDMVARSLIRAWSRGFEPAFRIGRHVFWKRRAAPVRQVDSLGGSRPGG